jgi:uncharacterized membrane protein
MGVRRAKRLYEDPPGLVPASYLPGGDFAAALRAVTGWRGRTRVALSFLPRLRVAPLYALAVFLSSAVLHYGFGDRIRDRMVLASSTNVTNLQNHRVWTLIASAFVLEDQIEIPSLVLVLLVMAVAELLWGWRRLIVVFLTGHVLASCLVYALLRIGVHNNAVPGAVLVAADVGTSYGLLAVSGAIAITLPVRARRIAVPLALLAVVVPLLVDRTFTDLGHLLATLIGFLAGLAMRRRPLAGRLRMPAVLRTDRILTYSYGSVAAANAALTAALRLQEHHDLRLDDATVAWPDQTHRIHVRQTRDLDALDGALAGGAWGLVIGTVIGVPLLAMIIGALVTAIAAHLHDSGLTDAVVESAVRSAPPGSAVLLLLTNQSATRLQQVRP